MPAINKIIFITSRVLSLVIVAFLALFILEGFSPGFSLGDSVIHGLFALAVLWFTLIAWQRPKLGGWIYVILGLKFFLIIFNPGFSWESFATGFIPLTIGILFLYEGYFKH